MYTYNISENHNLILFSIIFWNSTVVNRLWVRRSVFNEMRYSWASLTRCWKARLKADLKSRCNIRKDNISNAVLFVSITLTLHLLRNFTSLLLTDHEVALKISRSPRSLSTIQGEPFIRKSFCDVRIPEFIRVGVENGISGVLKRVGW